MADKAERESQILTPELVLLGAKALEAGVSEETFGKILTAAIDESVPGLVERLREDAPRMLAEHAELRVGFEQRLQSRWKQALGLYEMVLVCCAEVGSDLHDELAREGSPVSEHPAKLHALTLLHARACMVTNEVFALLRAGYAAGAQARWRTLHEIATIAFILGSGNDDLANRFLLHRYVERWREAQCYQDNCAALGQHRLSDSEMAQIRADYDKIVGQYEPGYEKNWGWSKPLFPSPVHKPNFDDLEKLAGLGHNKPFVKLSHHAIHSGASGTLDVLELYGRGEVMLAGPSNAGLAEPGHGCLVALYQVSVAYLLNGPNEVIPEDLFSLKAIALLLDEAGDAFAACEAQLEAEETAEAATQLPPTRQGWWPKLARLRRELAAGLARRRLLP